MLRQDYIGRLIEQLGQAIAKVVELVSQSRTDEAEAELAAAETALGLPRGLELLDARSAALVIGNGDKVVLAALLLEQRARLAEARQNVQRARRARLRAAELLRHASPHELRGEAAALVERLGADTSDR